jgi:DNA-binding transcriptional LysR family regulator
MAPSSSVRQITDAAFARAGLTPRPLYECTQPATLGAFIAAGLGISALPCPAARWWARMIWNGTGSTIRNRSV